MYKFKVGDYVLIKKGKSRSSFVLNGQVRKIIQRATHIIKVECKDINTISGLVWPDELELMTITPDDYEYV